jgi:hypothetical protein
VCTAEVGAPQDGRPVDAIRPGTPGRLGPVAEGGTELDLTDLAVTHGYLDHAHLVRDFTAFTGLSPTGWLRAERANVQADGADPPSAPTTPG